MDLTTGKTALLQALALMSDESELALKISNLMDSVHDEKSRAVTLLCEALALYKQEADKKKKVVNLLEEIAKWWTLLVEDREKLLLTISNLELEKEEILKKQSDPKEIYGAAMEAEATLKKRPRMMSTNDDDDDFKPVNSKITEVINIDA